MIVILPDSGRSLAVLLEELWSAAGPQLRRTVTTGHGGVVVPDELALVWLLAHYPPAALASRPDEQLDPPPAADPPSAADPPPAATRKPGPPPPRPASSARKPARTRGDRK